MGYTIGAYKGHGILQFKILRRLCKINRVRTLNFRRAGYGLFRDLVRIPWETTLKEKGCKNKWMVFKNSLLKVKHSPF